MAQGKGTPEFIGTTSGAPSVAVSLLFVPVFEGEDGLEAMPGVDGATGGDLSRARASGEFRGRLYEFFIARVSNGGFKAERVALIGAGRREDADAERLRRIAAACGYTARLRSMKSAGILVPAGLDPVRTARCFADGLSAAEFDSGSYKSERETGVFPARLMVVAPGADEPAVLRAVFEGRVLGESANFARALANEPANVLTPTEFANRVAAMSEQVGITCDVLEESRIKELKMGLLLGVAAGSAEPPRLVVMRHDPPGVTRGPVLGLIGKGVTFDTGGVSIKPADGMERMKNDMSGGAAVAGAMRALKLLGGRQRVIAVIPMTENAVGGRATRPGDVLTGASGTTVEIINTDAEGRLILGDAIWYAQELGATHLVDVATLTGACMVALGRTASGLFGTPDAWVETVRAAGQEGGDRLWPLPVHEEYRDLLKSEIADILNSAGRWAGAITAAMFLREFVRKDRLWAHLDIAGTAWAEERRAYQPKGATGVAVRTLAELGLKGVV